MKKLTIKVLVLAMVLLQVVPLMAQVINNNNANTQPQQQQQGFGWGGWMGFFPLIPLPPIPLPFFGGFGGMMGQGAGQQGTNNNQNVVVNTGDNQNQGGNAELMAIMQRILELLEKRENEETAGAASGDSSISGTAIESPGQSSGETAGSALNE